MQTTPSHGKEVWLLVSESSGYPLPGHLYHLPSEAEAALQRMPERYTHRVEHYIQQPKRRRTRCRHGGATK
jgi:hypothetical protein